MHLPRELGLPPGMVARQVICVYGTRDAGNNRQGTYTQVLEPMGFVTGSSTPCVFNHVAKDISIVVHGDDFTALGTEDMLDWYEIKLKAKFEIQVRGKLGEYCTVPQEIRILNRVVTCSSMGITYEADSRHSDLLMSSPNLYSSNSASSPGTDRDDSSPKLDEADGAKHTDYSDLG